METLLNLGLANALSATVLAVLVAASARLLARRPAILHCLWFLVLLKLLTPPLFEIPLPGRDADVPAGKKLQVSFDAPPTRQFGRGLTLLLLDTLADATPEAVDPGASSLDIHRE